MGLTIVVEYEDGERAKEVGDPTNILHATLPPENHPNFHCLNRIDWYGDTIFNRLQMQDVRKELENIIKETKSTEKVSLLRQILELVACVEESPHRYLRFIGD